MNFETFFANIKPTDKIALFHDTDPDGNTSGRIICDAVKLLGAEINLLLVHHAHSIPDELIIKMQDAGINKLITTDKTVDEGPNQILKIEKFAEICVFDHHVIQNDISSERTAFLKPQILFDHQRPDQYCSAKFTYDLLNTIVDVSYLDWLCCAGIIGDMAYDTWKEFVDSVLDKYGLEKKEDIFETKLGNLCQLISFAEAMKESEKCFDLILQAANLDDCLAKLDKYNLVRKEADHFFAKFNELAEDHDEVLWLDITSKHFIKTIIASRVSKKLHPHKTVIVTQQIGEWMTISARRSDGKIPMNILLKKSLNGLNGNGGGHVPASGASVSLEDYEQFKENLLRIAKEMDN